MIVLAHYFASRRSVTVATPSATPAETPKTENPLYLPSGSIRLLILGAFGFALIVLLLQGRLFDPAAVGTIALVFAYLGGILVRWLRGGKNKEVSPRWAWWVHLKAFVVLFACAIVLLATIGGGGSTSLPGWMEQIILAFILFYFGSR